jgi:hypothetical protein
MRRINVKKILKTTAIGLIALPEPFTTPLGIIMLCLVLIVYRKRSFEKFGDLEVLIRRSVPNTEKFGFRRYLGTEPRVQHHTKIDAVLPQHNSWFDNRKISASTLHHTLKTSFPQYEAAQDDKINLPAASYKKNKQVIEYHKLKTCQ